MISLCIVSLASQLAAQTPAKQAKPTPSKRVALWSGKAPVGGGKFEDCTLELEAFLPSGDKANGAAIVLCPGGGYIRHVTDREGYPIAKWLNDHGIATIILGVPTAEAASSSAITRCPARHPPHSRQRRCMEN